MSSSEVDEQRTAGVERALEGLIERLTTAEQTPRVRALRIEALRLRSIMANWRSIPPLAEVRGAMLDRVNHVISAASDLPLTPRKAPAPARPPPASIGPSPDEDEHSPLSYSDEETVVYDRSATPAPAAVAPAPARPAAAPPPFPKSPAAAAPPPPPPAPPPPPPPPPVEPPDDDDDDDEPEEAIAEPVDGPPQRSAALARRGAHGRSDSADAIIDPDWDGGIYDGADPWAGTRRGWPTGGVPALPAPPPTQVEVHLLDLPDRPDERLVMVREPASLRADAFRALRQRLATTGDPKLIVVSSPTLGEGKSTLAVNLALAYREVVRGGRVLLVEANARRPSLSTIFGFNPPACFFDQLATHRESPTAPWIAVEQIAPLHVMAIDPTIKRAPTLDAVGFSLAMGKLSQAGYDYVIVDAPAILESADVNLILESVEGLLMASRSGLSTQKGLKRALERLGPANVFGGVLLDVPKSAIA